MWWSGETIVNNYVLHLINIYFGFNKYITTVNNYVSRLNFILQVGWKTYIRFFGGTALKRKSFVIIADVKYIFFCIARLICDLLGIK
jgi:hypothetical protein